MASVAQWIGAYSSTSAITHLTCVQACTLDIASNLQRRAYSDGDVELMLWLLQMNGVADVPSLNQMKADQEFLDEVAGVEVKSFTGSFGHTYYMIPPREHIRMASNSTCISGMMILSQKTGFCRSLGPTPSSAVSGGCGSRSA